MLSCVAFEKLACHDGWFVPWRFWSCGGRVIISPNSVCTSHVNIRLTNVMPFFFFSKNTCSVLVLETKASQKTYIRHLPANPWWTSQHFPIWVFQLGDCSSSAIWGRGVLFTNRESLPGFKHGMHWNCFICATLNIPMAYSHLCFQRLENCVGTLLRWVEWKVYWLAQFPSWKS